MKDLKDTIVAQKERFKAAASKVKGPDSLQELRNQFLSRKKGIISDMMEHLKSLSVDEKRDAGQQINAFKNHVQDQIEKIQAKLEKSQKKDRAFDLTLPGRTHYWGAPHPLRIFQKRLEDIFLRMGFSIEDGPEIETDYFNFEALNFPPHHPARDDWDTLYLDDEYLLRTHTSPVQIRVMKSRKPPIRIIIPGKVYRKETPDPTHSPMFFQVEGLVVDVGISMAHLKGTLEYFLKALFHDKIKIRFRPSFFPFTEPSAEVDVSCTVCEGKKRGCRVCGETGWVEILGAGMVDPQVLKNVNIDPEKYSGFAFGMGIDRTAMFMYQIPDIRFFIENDVRFIRKFSRK
ncbi:phenylalanine--tRNA ligase subunit alpha [Acidobacteriota bacterium]